MVYLDQDQANLAFFMFPQTKQVVSIDNTNVMIGITLLYKNLE